MDTFVSIAIAIAAIDTPSSQGAFARQGAGGHGWTHRPSPLKKLPMRHMVPPTTPTAGAGPAPPTVLKPMDMRIRPRPLLCTQQQIQFYAGHQTAPISPNSSWLEELSRGRFEPLSTGTAFGAGRYAPSALPSVKPSAPGIARDGKPPSCQALSYAQRPVRPFGVVSSARQHGTAVDRLALRRRFRPHHARGWLLLL